MKNLTFKKKLFIIFIMTGLIPLVTISLLAYTTSMQNITYQVQKENELYFQLTKERLEAYFEEKKSRGSESGLYS
ncbi:MAG: hypothetical protein LRY71_06400 [Bacillaceae bacterium]|nr:hypothetical protein [Bacillaceae bacterium]